jgi:gamma-tubulin complex component 2
MDQGDFIVQFMDMAEDELAKEIDEIVLTRLSSLLELSLRTSIMNSDPHKDEVQIQIVNDHLLSQLSKIMNPDGADDSDQEDPQSLRGYESIALSYKVQWPLSLILNRKNIGCYQMLFRHLFYCKYVERQLEAVWKDNKVAKIYALKTVAGYAEAFALRQKMLNFVQNLSYYMMVEVIEPSFHSFIQKVNLKSQVDEISKEHTNFVEGCLKDCMIATVALQYMVQLLQLCMSFSEFMQKNHRHGTHYELQSEAAAPAATINEESGDEKSLTFEQKIRLMHNEFNSTLLNLLREIGNQQQDHISGNIVHILNRLDFNEYYARMREERDSV